MNKVCYKKYEKKGRIKYHIGNVRKKLKRVRAELIKLNGDHLIRYSAPHMTAEHSILSGRRNYNKNYTGNLMWLFKHP